MGMEYDANVFRRNPPAAALNHAAEKGIMPVCREGIATSARYSSDVGPTNLRFRPEGIETSARYSSDMVARKRLISAQYIWPSILTSAVRTRISRVVQCSVAFHYQDSDGVLALSILKST